MRALLAIAASLLLSSCASLSSVPGLSLLGPSVPTTGLIAAGAAVTMDVIAAKNGIVTGDCSKAIVAPDVSAACTPPAGMTDAQAPAALAKCVTADMQSQLATVLAKQLASICAKPTVAATAAPDVHEVAVAVPTPPAAVKP